MAVAGKLSETAFATISGGMVAHVIAYEIRKF